MPHITLDLTEFDQKNFHNKVELNAEAVKEAMTSLCKWNRSDLVAKLRWKLISAQRFDLVEITKIPVKEAEAKQIGNDEIVPYRLKLGKQKPLANPANIVIHRSSVIAFLMARPGHTFTGLVMIGHVEEASESIAGSVPKTRITQIGRPKMFLYPSGPANIMNNQNNTSRTYSVRSHDEGLRVKIYNKEIEGSILHQNSHIEIEENNSIKVKEGGGSASHVLLAELIKQKKKFLSQKEGHYVGFTVCKGWRELGLRNRYSTTSASSNAPAFGGDLESPHERLYPSEEWKNEIIAACDKLLDIEENYPEDSFITNLMIGKAKENDTWKALKLAYWPARQMEREIQYNRPSESDSDSDFD